MSGTPATDPSPSPPWTHLLDTRTADTPAMPPASPDWMRRHRLHIDPDTGWRFELFGGRRPGSRPARHDWAVVLTDPDEVVAAMVGDNGRARHKPEEIIQRVPGLARLVRAQSRQRRRAVSGPAADAEAAADTEVWERVRALHHLLCDPTSWHAPQEPQERLDGEGAAWAAYWASAGVLSATEARAWSRLGIEPDPRREGRLPWRSTGFTPVSAQPWLPLDNDLAAREWNDAGRTPHDALDWAWAIGSDGIVLSPDRVAALERHGWTPDLLSRLLDTSDSHSDRYRLLGEYLGHILWPNPQHALQPWQTLPPTRLLAYLEAGIVDPAEIDQQERSGSAPSDDQLRVLATLRVGSEPGGLLHLV